MPRRPGKMRASSNGVFFDGDILDSRLRGNDQKWTTVSMGSV